MRAMTVVPGKPDSAGVSEMPEPPESDGALLVQGEFVGICGTDAEIVQEGYGVVPDGQDRLVLCHESLGRVLEAPAGSGFAEGDLVAGIVRRPDPVPCRNCANGEWDFCRNGRYTERGIKERNGYGSTRWRIEPEFAIPLDPSLGDLGVLVEPTSVVAKAWDVAERLGARATFEPEKVLITGAGPIGLLAALIGVQRGLDVHVLDLVTEGPKPQLVADLGGTYHSGGVDALDFEPDVVIECTGVGKLVFDIAEQCAPNAVIALTGISAGSPVSVDLSQVNKDWVLENTVVFGSVNAGRGHYDMAASALARADESWLRRLISRRVPLADWPAALRKGNDDVKVVVELG